MELSPTRSLLSFQEVLASLQAKARKSRRPARVELPLLACHGRILASPVVSPDLDSNSVAFGADHCGGETLAETGSSVSPELIMACAAIGIESLSVYEPLRIALLATGRELQRHFDSELREGATRDATGPYLSALFRHPAYELILHKIVPDDADMFAREINLCLELQPDIIISTGAVSMKRHHFVPKVLEHLGASLVFHQVALWPLEAMLFAEWAEGPALFGLPGHPLATLSAWRFFGESYARQLLGCRQEAAFEARLETSWHKAEQDAGFYQARVVPSGTERRIEILGGLPARSPYPWLDANAWAFLPQGSGDLAVGSRISCFPLRAPFEMF